MELSVAPGSCLSAVRRQNLPRLVCPINSFPFGWRAARCCSGGLMPRPRPTRRHFVEQLEVAPAADPARAPKPWSFTLCDRIERLVFFRKYREALDLFEILRSADETAVRAATYDALVTACVGLGVGAGRAAKSVFRHSLDVGFQYDQYMRNRMLLMHLKCGLLADARQLFDQMPERNAVTWNTMITGLIDAGCCNEGLDLFLLLWEDLCNLGPRAFASAIRAVAGLGDVFAGQQLHSIVVKLDLYSNSYISCALVDMYSKCGCIESAQLVFDEISEKTVVAWNTIIAGYALHGYSEEALQLYYEMQNSNVKMDQFTYSIVVRICARLGSLEHAKQAHAGLVRNGFNMDIVASTTLVDLYSKWGRVEDARNVFEKMPCKNLISWNALIGGYANHGKGKVAVDLYERMLQEGMTPNHVTHLAVLNACCNSGLVERGKQIFEFMSQDPKMKPRAMHYACMIELLGRMGHLDEALSLIKNAPFEPTTNMWAALLTACRIHNNLELGKYAAEQLFELEPEKLGNYIVMLNLCSRSGKGEDAAKVLDALRKKGLRLLPACSWIEIKKQSFCFLFGDKSHPLSNEIHRRLDALMEEIRGIGYVAEDNAMLSDVSEHEQNILIHHSEMLAIAFGLISTTPRTSLQIVQGHRICSNCHNMIKFVTELTKREIVVRDASRFHYFRHGKCSCRDYW